MSALLNVADVDAGYGDFQALFGIDLVVDEGELLALVGANGAGKSTLLRTIVGALKPFGGTVRFAGEDVTAEPDIRRARKGIGLVPEGRRLFPSLTVEENLQVGAATGRKGPWDLAKVYEAMPLVADRRTRRAARLSGGEQQAVAIGRALMGNPRLLLLDEVSLGLAPLVVDQLYTALPGIRAERHDGGPRRTGPQPHARRGGPYRLRPGRAHRAHRARRPAHPRAGDRRLLRHRHSPGGDFLMTWVNAIVQGMLLGGIFAMAAAGLSLIFGVMRIANLAHGDLMILGGYVASVAAAHYGVPVPLTVLVSMTAVGALGYLVQRSMLDRAMSLGELTPMLVTFGISLIIPNVLVQVFSNDAQPLSTGSLGTASIDLGGGLAIGWFPLITVMAAVAVLTALHLFLHRTQPGRVVRATADDRTTVRLMGVDNRRIYALTSVIAFATVALAGSLYTMRQGGVTPYEGQLTVLFAFETVIIGGLGSLWGTLAGGMVLGIAQSVGAQISPDLPLLAGHLVFLLILVVRPQGLFGRSVLA
ncbi:ATP-binding cassette domain-containing protein [Streptomyces sp. NPDC001286]